MKNKNDRIVLSSDGEVNFDRTRATWNIMKITSELVEGYERLDNIAPAVSIFGSARLKENDKYYKSAHAIAKALSDKGFAVISGGGGGIMEAANKGATEGLSPSIGLNISLPFEQSPNQHQDISLFYRYFFTRKAMFIKHSMAYIAMPGGFGTFDELFDIATLIQTKKKATMPIILFGKSFWGGLLEWINTTLVESGVVSKCDTKMLVLVDSVDEVVKIIEQHHKNVYDPKEDQNIIF